MKPLPAQGYREAYAMLGLAFVIVFGAAFLLYERAQAPTTDELSDVNSQPPSSMSLTLTSSAFAPNGLIPSQYTCDGDNVHPPLTIAGVPAGTKSLVLVMDDPDIPEEFKQSYGIEKYNHWVVFNLPADLSDIPAGANLGSPGFNSNDQPAYAGPCPPPDKEPREHRYIFRLYALPEVLHFIKTPTLDEVEEVAKADALEAAQLIGRYSRATETNQ